MDAPTFGEVPEVRAGERGSAVGPEAERDTNFSEVAAKHPSHSGECGILSATTGQPESLSAITKKDFPATWKKSADTDSKGLVGWSSHCRGSRCWLDCNS